MARLRDVSAPKAPSKDEQGRPLPSDLEAERHVLACVLHTGDIKPVRDLLTRHDFHAPMHAEIWATMLELDARNVDPAHHSVTGALRAAGRLQTEMGTLLADLRRLEDDASRSLVDLARKLALLGLRRRMLGEIWHAAKNGYAELQDDRAWLEDLHSAVTRVVAEARDVRAYGLVEAHDSARAVVAAAHGRGDESMRGISTGIRELDEKIGGLRAGELTLLSGPTGRGKSALALNVGLHVSRQGKGVLYLQLEDSAAALAMRAACIVGLIDSKKLRAGEATIDEQARFEQAREWMAKTPLQIVDDPEIGAVGVTGSVARSRLWMQERGSDLSLVIVDYLQLVSGRSLIRERDNREQEVSAVARALSKLAVRERVAVLALSQLNDDGAIRESRAVLQHAANWFDLQLCGTKVLEGEPVPMNIKVRKQRHGPYPPPVPVWVHAHHPRFEAGI